MSADKSTEQITVAKFLSESAEADKDLPEEDLKLLEEMAKDNAGEIKTREEWSNLVMIYAECSDLT